MPRSSALLSAFPGARDVEVRGASLEEAFLELTADEDDHDDRDAIGEPPSPGQEESQMKRHHPRALRAPSGAAQLAHPASSRSRCRSCSTACRTGEPPRA